MIRYFTEIENQFTNYARYRNSKKMKKKKFNCSDTFLKGADKTHGATKVKLKK